MGVVERFLVVLVLTLIGIGTSAANCIIRRGTEFRRGNICDTGKGRLWFQDDGNVVITTWQGRAVWATGTEERGQRAVFQEDGNFVVYDYLNRPIWSTGTEGRGDVLKFQDDRNLCIYSSENWNWNSLWCSWSQA